MSKPSIADLQRAIQISEQIEKLEAELRAILGFEVGGGGVRNSQVKRRGRPPKSGAVVSGQPIGDATSTGSTEPKAKRKKRKLSPESRARIVAAVKARWAREKGTK